MALPKLKISVALKNKGLEYLSQIKIKNFIDF